MITLHRAIASNFLCFSELDWNIGEESGLIGVYGENNDCRSMSDSNGAGKSSLFEVLFWGLYGKNTKGLRHDQMVKIGSSSCCVEIQLEKKGVLYSIRRYRNDKIFKNGLFLDALESNTDMRGESTKETQAHIESIIGMSSRLFQMTVLFGSGGMEKFSELSDTEKKEMIEELLQVDIWEQSHMEAKSRRKEKRKLLDDLGHQITSYKTLLENDHLRMEEANASMEGWSEQQVEKRVLLEAEKARLEEKASGFDAESSIVLDSTIEELGSSLDTLRLFLKTQRNEVSLALSTFTHDLRHWDMRFDANATHCPTCRQSLSDYTPPTDDEKEQRVQIASEISRLESELRGIDSHDQIAELKDQINECMLEKHRIEFMKKQYDLAQERLFEIDIALQSLDQRENPHIQYIQTVQSDLKKRTEELESNRSLLDAETVNCDVLDMLEKIFGTKGIRAYLFESAIPEINALIDEYVSVVTGGSMSCALSLTSESSKGEVIEKISIDLNYPTGSDNYNGCSSGEKKRLDVPIALALQRFAQIRGLSVGVCFLDEVYENMDNSGLIGLQELLMNMTYMGTWKTVYVISHQKELTDVFPTTGVVRKSNGSSKWFLNGGTHV